MVNLPSESVQGREGGEGSGRIYRSNWRLRHGRRGHTLAELTEPTSLHQLEAMALKTVKLMEKYAPESEHNFTKAMDLLRQQYNMNFIILCEKCKGTHGSDEILAPER